MSPYTAGCTTVLPGHARAVNAPSQLRTRRRGEAASCGEPPPLSRLRPDAPLEIEDLLRGMLAKDSEQRLAASAVYEALLPWAHKGFAKGSPHLLTADGLELDPCLPFSRPFGGSARRGATAAVAYTPTVVDQPVPSAAAAAAPAPLTDAEADEAAGRAEQLVGDGQFAQAADILAAALARAVDAVQVEDLSLSLAHVKFVAGAHREAAELFEAAIAAFTDRYGADDAEAQRCRYYAAQSRMELRESTAALIAFNAYATSEPDPDDPASVTLHLDALAQIMRLHAGAEHSPAARSAAITLRSATVRHLGSNAPELAEVDGFISRLGRFQR
ncbi:hypothetical protein [Streptomyces sp. H27-D2]|uniref:hypothetical protein n=1 Tax=Streptomyces sp. H27-D2 TaxID=3046304 RepID=UPI002DB74714|nr:hypothetical protein [Streptomyces sp. H27-D2]MEC4017520.1 hypothetical protein [Streptomyces sp. H27-D2]